MTSEKVYKPKVHLGTDTETLAMCGHAAIVEIGVVLVMGNVPEEVLHVKIKPSSYEGSPFIINSDTVDWHNGLHPDYLSDLEANGVSYQEAAQLYFQWMERYKNNTELHVWSQGKDFDFPKLAYLLEVCGYPKTPYAYSNIHCARDLVWLNPGARISGGGTSAKHTAVDDAQWMARQIRHVVARSSWYQKLFV